MSYEFEVEGLEKIAALQAYDRICTEELARAMRDSLGTIALTASNLAPKWRGNLAGSMTSRVFSSVAEIGEVYSNAQPPDYPLVMEYGRRADKKPPPVEAIRAWAEDHGLSPYAVAISIGKKGIKGQHFLRRAYEISRTTINVNFGVAVDRIARRLSGKG